MNYRALLFALPLFVLFGCKKKLTQFYVDYNSSVVIPSTFGQLVPFSVYTPEMETNSEAEFQSNNTRKDKIEEIKLDQLVLRIISPQNETFSFLNSIEVYISSPNVAEKKVAYRESIPSDIGQQLVCEIVDTELQDYIKDDTFTIRLRTVTDETIPNDVEVNVYSKFWVDAKLVK